MNDGVIFYKSHFDNIKDLSNEEIGIIFRACMTGEEVSMSPHVKMAFNFINSQVKRDVEKYAAITEKRRAAGRLGGIAKGLSYQQKDEDQGVEEIAKIANAKSAKQKIAKIANESNNINNNNNNNTNNNSNNNNEINTTNSNIERGANLENNPCSAVAEPRTLEGRKLNFERSLIPYLDDYGKDMLREFADYWTEPDRAKKPKMRFEKEKTWSTPHRLSTWARREREYPRRQQTSRFQASQDSMQAFIDSLPKE